MMHKKPFDEAKAKEVYMAGGRDQDIADATGYSKSFCAHWRKNLGLPPHRVAAMESKAAQGDMAGLFYDSHMAHLLGISYGQYMQRKKEMGL